MIFLDASAAVAILTDEPEGPFFLSRVERAKKVFASAIVAFETTAAVARKHGVAIDVAEGVTSDFLTMIDARMIPIDAKAGTAALKAFADYGEGRHPAALNMGDCFTYACATLYRLPVLFKGDDFPATDIKDASLI